MKERIKGGLALVLLALFAGGCTFYHSAGSSAGNYVREVSGSDFEPVSSEQWDPEEHALVYFYRPQSQWADDELEAPSVYIDDSHYFNLRGGSYTWLEVYPGERDLDMRRPFMTLEALGGNFDHIVETTLEVEAGETYYIRYSEVDEPDNVHSALADDHELATSEARLVESDAAQPEIQETRFLESQLLASNSAGQSIVTDNLTTDFEQRRSKLEKQRQEEIEELKAQGDFNPSPWYWPFGKGQPARPLETDEKLERLEAERQAYLVECCQWGKWRRQCDQPNKQCGMED